MKKQNRHESALPPRPEEDAVREAAAGERCCPYCGAFQQPEAYRCPLCGKELPWQFAPPLSSP